MISSTLKFGGAIGARAYVTYEFRIIMTNKIAISAVSVCSEKKPQKARSQEGGVGGSC
jgi:hypothetical protein